MSALPSPEYSRNMRLIGHSDQGGRPDGVQLMVHRGFAYIGHMVSQGFSIVDVRDPKNPKAAGYVPAPPGTWNVVEGTDLKSFHGVLSQVQRRPLRATLVSHRSNSL